MIRYNYKLQAWIMIILIVAIMLILDGCKTHQTIPADYPSLADQVEDISSAKNITSEQKVILKDTVAGLKQAGKLAEENTKLREEVVSASKGTRRVVYAIVGGLVIIMLISGVLRVLRPI